MPRRIGAAREVHRDVVVVGASAGGVEALQAMVHGLPKDMPGSVFVVLHLSPDAPSALPRILSRAGSLPARYAEDGTPVAPGVIYVAPPGRHLVLVGKEMKLVHEAAEHRVRPAVDPLFRSAAVTYGPRAVGVVLSGTLDDGTEGLARIKAAGGVAVVQDPDDAAFSSMPRNALEFVAVDHCVAASSIGPLLARLAREAVVPPAVSTGPAVAVGGPAEVMTGRPAPESSVFGCPDCGGVLWEQEKAGVVRFRCRVGHAFSVGSLAAAQDHEVEKALWVAMRALEERHALFQRMIERTSSPSRRQRLTREAGDVARRADLLRRVVGARPHRPLPH